MCTIFVCSWQVGLLERLCSAYRRVCLGALFCPCWLYGQTRAIASKGNGPSASLICCLYAATLLLPSAPCWLAALSRAKVRRAAANAATTQSAPYLILPSSRAVDCVVHLCCCCCALRQEYVEMCNLMEQDTTQSDGISTAATTTTESISSLEHCSQQETNLRLTAPNFTLPVLQQPMSVN